MSKILVVEDDLDINKLLEKILQKQGYEVVCAFSGTEADLRLSLKSFDLVLCDLMIPGISGEELIGRIRKGKYIPIIALTAKLAIDDKVKVLELGADDYMTKPFEVRELLARVKVQIRRGGLLQEENMNRKHWGEDSNMPLTYRDLFLYQESRIVELRGEKLDLTAHEFDILRTMMENPQKVFSKDALYEAVWENGYYGEDNTVSVHISNIRKKMGRITQDEYISTVWGIGYKLNL
ncbi:response regulator transcription factor [Anaeromicropila populeti]|uniref:Stage 0 sporulation protein A homolog n=1 Tax=Anaeromicropila populeti TaxID=37658 RepID=A0A1I6K9G2_9FIRM|nr:response regulator transcription factor [Anaeromicropila populeti]SFR87784.1 DNA-binding response regulator, OmpR family, contains REC and winged-helix (wHTH) domain [Anaeromicropila populeti]